MPVTLFVVPGNGYCCVKGMVQMLLLVDDNNAVVMKCFIHKIYPAVLMQFAIIHNKPICVTTNVCCFKAANIAPANSDV